MQGLRLPKQLYFVVLYAWRQYLRAFLCTKKEKELSFDDFDKLFNNGDPGDGDEIGAINYLGKDEDAASRAGEVVSRYTDGEVHAEDLLNSFDMDFDFDNPRKITEDANNSPVYRGNSGPGTISFRFDNSHEEKEHGIPREEKKTDIRS